MNKRIDQLEEFLREDPADPFNKYALALEYLKVDSQKAHELFSDLISKTPEYLPSYYPFAHLLIDLKKIDEADNVFRSGIRVATQQAEHKTLRELQNAYNDWQFDKS